MFPEFSKIDKIVLFSFNFFKYLRLKKNDMNVHTVMQTNELNLSAFRYPNKLLRAVDIQKSSFIAF